MKLNKIKYEDILSYEEFMLKYKNEIRKNNISKNILSHMRASILDNEYYIFKNYINKVQDILIAIAEVKYMDPGRPDIGSIFKLFKAALYLLNDIGIEFSPDYYNLKEIYNKAYDELKDNVVYKEYFIGKENEIDYSFDKLLDVKYHLNNFRNYCDKDNPYNDEFIDILNRELWRFI